MSAETQYLPSNHASSGQVHDGPGWVKHFHLVSSGTAGTIVFKDGGSSGDVVATYDTPAVAEGDEVNIPGAGLRFEDSIYMELTNADGVTVHYRKT